MAVEGSTQLSSCAPAAPCEAQVPDEHVRRADARCSLQGPRKESANGCMRFPVAFSSISSAAPPPPPPGRLCDVGLDAPMMLQARLTVHFRDDSSLWSPSSWMNARELYVCLEGQHEPVAVRLPHACACKPCVAHTNGVHTCFGMSEPGMPVSPRSCPRRSATRPRSTACSSSRSSPRGARTRPRARATRAAARRSSASRRSPSRRGPASASPWTSSSRPARSNSTFGSRKGADALIGSFFFSRISERADGGTPEGRRLTILEGTLTFR